MQLDPAFPLNPALTPEGRTLDQPLLQPLLSEHRNRTSAPGTLWKRTASVAEPSRGPFRSAATER
jgi:hypothetical protein